MTTFILIWLGAGVCVAIGYGSAMSRHHRFMADAWMRCRDLALHFAPTRIDPEWEAFTCRLLDQFAGDRFNTRPLQHPTADDRIIR